MKATSLLASFALLLLLGGSARADVKWDSKGWVKLGERDVHGNVDKDTITVGAYEGKFAKLTLLVDKSDLDLLDFEIVFGNGEKHNPNVKHYFKEGSRTRVLDLPGDERIIKDDQPQVQKLCRRRQGARRSLGLEEGRRRRRQTERSAVG